jgi:two-component system, cell cycle response regulator
MLRGAMRMTSNAFLDLAIWMVGLGLAVGALVPLSAVALGVPSEIAWASRFVVACLVAGALVGAGSVVVARAVLGTRLRRFASGMHRVREGVAPGVATGACDGEDVEAFALAVDSDDAFGDGARAFNGVLAALAVAADAQRAYLSFSATLATRRELDELAAEALTHYARYAGAAAGMVLYESGGELVLAASRGFADPTSLVASDHVVGVARSGVRNERSAPGDVLVEGGAAPLRPHTVVIDPIVDRDVQLGVVVLASATGFDAAQRSRIDLFGRGLALALHTALANDRLQRLAAVDPLTGMLNRRFGLERLREEFGRSVRAGSALGVLMLDIDDFKSVNDAYGHLVGDRVLRTVALITRAALRDGDVVARYGGEEFLIVLPAAGAAELGLVAERIRALVANATLVEGTHDVRVTLSIGGAAYPDCEVDSEDALLRLADAARHGAKRAGGDSVAIAP